MLVASGAVGDGSECSTRATPSSCRQLPTSSSLTSSLPAPTATDVAVLITSPTRLLSEPKSNAPDMGEPGREGDSSDVKVVVARPVLSRLHSRQSTTLRSSTPPSAGPSRNASRQRFLTTGKSNGEVTRVGSATRRLSRRTISSRAERIAGDDGGSNVGGAAMPDSLHLVSTARRVAVTHQIT